MHTVTAHAILFDLDGTLIDSTPGVLKAWHAFATDYGFDAADVARRAHGRRLCDTLKEYCHIHDEEKLQAEIVRFEELVIRGSPLVLPGALNLLHRIGAGPPEAASGWTIVTSATNVYAARAFERCALPLPPLGLVTSNDVVNGTPLPDPYLASARRLGVDPANCLVVEDAPSGILAGRAAGCKVIAVCTSHTRQSLLDSGARPDYIVRDLTRISARWIGEILEVTIDDA
ncbi:uncharacterized protein PHACADRAFT_246844, partial [Phanerochaete carnosa HHB-10118-sp]